MLDDNKRRFAELWAANPSEPLKAALQVFTDRDDFAKAAEAASLWPQDPDVVAYRKEFTEQQGGELALLPGKAEYARQLYRYATQNGFPSQERFKFMELYGKVMEYVPLPGRAVESKDAPAEPTVITRRIIDPNSDGT